MDEKLETELIALELNGDEVVQEDSNYNEKRVTFLSPSFEPVDKVVLKETNIDGRNKSDAKSSHKCRHHVVRSSIASLTETMHEKVHNVNSTESVTKLINIQTVVSLVAVICFMIMLFSVPLILYFTKPAAVELYTIDGADFKRCSVSTLIKSVCVHYSYPNFYNIMPTI